MHRRAWIGLAWLAIAALPGGSATAQDTVFITRHAEKASAGDDPALTEKGRADAAALARMLSAAGVDAVITSDTRRTRETGQIVAQALGLARSEHPAADVTGLVDLLGFDHEEDKVLVVGHAETIPGILTALGVQHAVTIEADDFSNLFVVTFADGGEARLAHLRLP